MTAVSRVVSATRDGLVRRSDLDQDAMLYCAAAVLAAGTVAMAVSADYRQWAEMAVGPYAAGAIVCALVARRRRRRQLKEPRVDWVRRVVVLAMLVAAVLAPLTVEVILRAQAKPGAHAQPEVPVIERCGDRVAHHQNCYPINPTTPGISPSSDSPSIDANSFFPYLPGMIPFGLINATSGPPELKDARVALSGFTLIVVGLSLALSGIPERRRWRILQVAVVLPTGALPMVTGGDDLPVIALLLLSVVMATRRRPVASGIAMGLAGTLKFTAWPLLVLLGLAERDTRGRRAILRYSFSVLAVVVPVLGIGIGLNPHAFLENAIRFPLGLTRVKSPAASPLVGQELVSLLPRARPEVVALLALAGMAAVGYGLWRWRPSTPAQAAGFTGLAIGLATLIAPATRFGYLIYPLNLLTWSVLFRSTPGWALSPDWPARGTAGPEPDLVQDPSGTWKSRSDSRVVAEDWEPPASAGEIAGVTEAVTTPSSHS